MEAKFSLTPGVEMFTLTQLLEKAAWRKGVKIQKGPPARFRLALVKEYLLDTGVLMTLHSKGIKQYLHPSCGDKTFTLMDENVEQPIRRTYIPNNYWSFQLAEDADKYNLRIKLFVEFSINMRRRGILLSPVAKSPYISAQDHLPNFRMFQVLTQSDLNPLPIAKEIAESDGEVMLTWGQLGFAGIRSLDTLFAEFCDQNLPAKTLHGIFSPGPYTQGAAGDELFVIESAQPKIFDRWQAQLNEFCAKNS